MCSQEDYLSIRAWEFGPGFFRGAWRAGCRMKHFMQVLKIFAWQGPSLAVKTLRSSSVVSKRGMVRSWQCWDRCAQAWTGLP